jgi:hypothetical protein
LRRTATGTPPERRISPRLCLHTRPGAELEAEWHLRSQAYAAWCPLIAPRRGQSLIVRLFARYVFAQCTAAAPNWGPMRHTRGAYAPGDPRAGGDAAAALDMLWRQCEPNGVIYPREVKIAPSPVGKRVSVEIGSFAGLSGICRHANEERLTILLTILGGEREIRIRRQDTALA